MWFEERQLMMWLQVRQEVQHTEFEFGVDGAAVLRQMVAWTHYSHATCLQSFAGQAV